MAIAGNYIVKYKVININDVVIQFLGFSYFIEPQQRLNVATWFITLVILCYILAVFILAVDRMNFKKVILYFLFLATLWLGFLNWHIEIWRQVLAFESGMLISMNAEKNKGNEMNLLVIPVLLVLSIMKISCSYALISAVSLVVFPKVHLIRFSRVVSWIARYSYEIFFGKRYVSGIFCKNSALERF